MFGSFKNDNNGSDAMEKLDPIPEDANRDDVHALFSELKSQARMPFVPNFMRVCANAPLAANGIWDCMKKVMLQGAVDPALKQLMFVAISAARSCQYCEAAHLSWCRMMGVDDETLARVAESAEDPAITPPMARDVIRFAVKCALAPAEVQAADYASLRHHRLTDAQIMEIIAMAGMAVFHNIIADATGISIDAAFQPQNH
jgi:uncharacterized peroxidase-related enzyme